jgi:hypothetical protein
VGCRGDILPTANQRNLLGRLFLTVGNIAPREQRRVKIGLSWLNYILGRWMVPARRVPGSIVYCGGIFNLTPTAPDTLYFILCLNLQDETARESPWVLKLWDPRIMCFLSSIFGRNLLIPSIAHLYSNSYLSLLGIFKQLTFIHCSIQTSKCWSTTGRTTTTTTLLPLLLAYVSFSGMSQAIYWEFW